MSDAIKEAMSAIFGSNRTLIAVGGVLLLILGASGGYKDYAVISNDYARIALFVIGTILVLLWVWQSLTRETQQIDPKPYGVKITNPTQDDLVDVVTVRGSLLKALPKGYELRTLRYYPTGKSYVPHGTVVTDIGTKSWKVEQFDIGASGKGNYICVYIAGPAGCALLDYFLAAQETHKKLLDILKVPLNERTNKYLPHLTKDRLEPDMVFCDRVGVRKKSASGA